MKIVILTLSLFLNLVVTFAQTNYYVSPAGNNSNSGSLTMPWQTIQYGLDQLNTNDTLNVLTGTFTEKISIPASNICLRNNPGNTPVIDATGITTQDAIIVISDLSNVTIDGLTLKNNIQNDAQGILVEGSGSNITLKNCILHDIHFSSNINAPVNASTNAQGIIVYGTNAVTPITNLKIQNNQLYDCRLGFSEGIAVNGNVNGFEVSGNIVYNLTNIGIDVIGHEGTCSNPANDQARNGLVKNNNVHDCLSPYATSGGIYIDGGKMITVENNTSYKNGYGIEVGCENVGKTTDAISIRNNLFYDNEICSIALGGFDYPSGSGKVINSSIRNNTCYSNDFSDSGFGELYLSYSESSVIENNIFYTTSQNVLSYAELSQPSLVFNYNIVYCQSGANALTVNWNGNTYTGYAAFVSGSGTNVNSIFADPQFVLASITNPDFHLMPASLCINSGNPSYIPSGNEVDLDGELRANGGVDCGADEFYTTTGIIENTSTCKDLLYPNPSYDYFMLNNIAVNSQIEIINNLGQIVFQSIISPSEQINVTDLPTGLYTIRLNNDLQQTLKFIKQ